MARPRPPIRMALAAGLLPLLAACVVVPQTTRVYDTACGVATSQIVLDVAVLPGFYNCRAPAVQPFSSTISAPAPPCGALACVKASTSALWPSQRCALALSTGWRPGEPWPLPCTTRRQRQPR